MAENPLVSAGVHGGLVVQVGAEEPETVVELSRTGRYIAHILETDPGTVDIVRKVLAQEGIYGLASAETLIDLTLLPYTENVVNAVLIQSLGKVSLTEVFRILVPHGALVVPGLNAGVGTKELLLAGFEQISKKDDGQLVARKPWPENMDSWSHPRHGANGNAVSQDTAVGPPQRVRWVAAAMSEVEGLVTDAGRNFYGGVLARDSFNGLRLWHMDLGKGELNDSQFTLPRLSYSRARPIVSGGVLFAIVDGKLVSLDAATGKPVNEYPGLNAPTEVIQHQEVVIAADSKQVLAFNVKTAKELWRHEASEPRSLAASGDVASFIRGRPKRGENAEAMAVDLRTGKVRWQASFYPWLKDVYRTVMHGDQVTYEVSSLNDHDFGNALHVLSAKTGQLDWEKEFPPGMSHQRQARAMYTEKDLWILHGGKENTKIKADMTRSPIQVSALDPKTGKILKTHSAGLAHCFPPVATPRYVFAGVLDMTDMETGDIVANRITKANCSRENGWVPANGLIYTTPKHCTCWPMLRGFVAMAPARLKNPAAKPVDRIQFPLVKGVSPPKPDKADAGDWPTYRGDRWRSGSSSGQMPSRLGTQWSVKLVDPKALPDGPILHDWRENPFVKGPISAPTIADGRVFVAHSDAHQVIAMDASNGRELWRFTARGRVDLPPTIHQGLVLFGCHGGYVYALRADNAKLVWRFRAAPIDERIVAYGQVESPWPVPGSVLVRNDTAYFVAGRQQLADGGVLIFALDPKTGEQRWVHRLDHIPQKGFYENSGLEFDPIDILHEEGAGIAMSRWLFSSDGDLVDVNKWNAFAKLDTGGGAVWVPRGSWTYGARHQDRFKGEAPRRPLVAFRDGRVFGQLNGSNDVFRRDFDAATVAKFSSKWITGWEAAKKGRAGQKPFRSYRVADGAKWNIDAFTPTEEKERPFKRGMQMYNDLHAMALSGNDRLCVVHKDGRLKVLNGQDGVVIAERVVPNPMWDGLAIAQGKLFLSTLSGELLCIGSD